MAKNHAEEELSGPELEKIPNIYYWTGSSVQEKNHLNGQKVYQAENEYWVSIHKSCAKTAWHPDVHCTMKYLNAQIYAI